VEEKKKDKDSKSKAEEEVKGDEKKAAGSGSK
jgi:hypothetical protein